MGKLKCTQANVCPHVHTPRNTHAHTQEERDRQEVSYEVGSSLSGSYQAMEVRDGHIPPQFQHVSQV